MPRPKKIPAEKICAMSIRIPQSLRDEIQILADEDERSLNLQILRLLRLAVDAEKLRRHQIATASPSPQ